MGSAKLLEGAVVGVEAGEFLGQRFVVRRQGVELHAMLSGCVVERRQAVFCLCERFRIGVEAVFVAPERIGGFLDVHPRFHQKVSRRGQGWGLIPQLAKLVLQAAKLVGHGAVLFEQSVLALAEGEQRFLGVSQAPLGLLEGGAFPRLGVQRVQLLQLVAQERLPILALRLGAAEPLELPSRVLASLKGLGHGFREGLVLPKTIELLSLNSGAQ